MKGKVARTIFVIFLSFSLIMSGCGGGDGGDGTTTATSAGTSSPGVAAKGATDAISLASTGLNSIANPGQAAPSFKRSKSINGAVADFYTNLTAARKASQSKAPMMVPITTPCPGGGTLTTDFTATTYTMTANNCVTNNTATDISIYENGTITWSQTGSGFNMTMGTSGTPLTVRETRISDSRFISESVSNMTISGSFSGAIPACGGQVVPDSATITMNGSFSSKEDTNMDGILNENISTAMNSLTLNVTIQHFNPTTCEPDKGSLQMSGSVSFTDNIDTNESVSMSVSAANPLTITWEAVTGGENNTINGTFTVNTACFTGSLTLTTQTTIFQPNSSDCPTSGVINVTGDITATITYTSTGGVQIDDGSNGSVDLTLSSCNDAEACI